MNIIKPKLSVDEQIEHLKSKGVLFKIMDEEEAKDYLIRHNNYFKLTAYRKNYSKHPDGKNINNMEEFGMATSIKPVFYKGKEKKDYINNLFKNIKETVGVDADLLLDYPVIYIHVWRSKYDVLNGTYSIYVGETNDIIGRTNEHWCAAMVPMNKRKAGNWQHHMSEDVDEDGNVVTPTIYIFGHKLFNKSMTLDIENKLIDYCYSMPTAHIYNGRTNPQGNYSGDDDFDVIFSMIWKILRKENSELFLSESTIKKSAIYKTSPNHKLTDEQKKAKSFIVERFFDAYIANKKEQLIFVEGEVGTGKTVLTSSTFYEILENKLFCDLDLKCYMLINHMEQMNVYKNMVKKLGYDEQVIQIPTSFLKEHSILDKKTNTYLPDEENIVDIVFVDEAHLLWNQRNQAYNKKFKNPQLEEIIKRSRVTVIMFDENQILHKGQIYENEYMNKMRKLAKNQGPNPLGGESNYLRLTNQLRMNCSLETIKWIDDLSKGLIVSDIFLDKNNKDKKGYQLMVFDNPEEMHKKIKEKALKDETQLSRIVATCDWEYLNSYAPDDERHYWKIEIGEWYIPWNEEIFWRDMYFKLNNRERKHYKFLDWAEKEYSIDEAGSTFTIQGFDLSFVGVIIGPSVKYNKRTKTIYFDESCRTQSYMVGKRTLSDGSVVNVTDLISRNELRVLLTRGTQGLYIYACDVQLRNALKDAIKYEKV